MKKVEALAICVNYQNAIQTESFLQQLYNLNGYSDEVALVVDNSNGTDGLDVSKLENISRNLIVISPGRNLGYFGGASFGLSEYLKERELPEWVIVSNTDIEFPDEDMYLKLKNYSSKRPAIIAPDIQLRTRSWLPSSAKHQNPCMRVRPSVIRMHAIKFVCSMYPLLITYKVASSLRYAMLDVLSSLSRTNGMHTKADIYAPFGAFIIFHKTYFESGGTLNHGVFLFGEEIFVAETAQRLNLRVVFDPMLKVIHHEHSSLNKVNRRFLAKYAREATRYVADTFFAETP